MVMINTVPVLQKKSWNDTKERILSQFRVPQRQRRDDSSLRRNNNNNKSSTTTNTGRSFGCFNLKCMLVLLLLSLVIYASIGYYDSNDIDFQQITDKTQRIDNNQRNVINHHSL